MIFKKRLQNRFTAISNEICTNTSISTDARWCLWYLLTKPEDWEVRINDIRQVSGWGRDKVKSAINELVTARYVVKRQERADGGQFDVNAYDVYEFPVADYPLTENPLTDYPVTENTSLNKDLKKPSTEKKPNTEKDIYLEGFQEFWDAYPKRPGNSRKDALKAYTKACQKLKVPHQDIMAGVKAYAAFREGEPPQYTKTAAAWLNGWMWESDWTVSGNKPEPKAVKPEAPAASDTDLDAIVSKYPGVVSDRAEARKILGSELSKGTELKAIVEAAEKYKLYIREMKQNDVPIAPPILETWLKFKWRDMDAYFIFKSVTQPYPTLKPVSEKPKWWGKL
jgi:hypothetical protein